MKGIYLTPEGKQEIETKIAELEEKIKHYEVINSKQRRGGALAQIFALQEILTSATILPVEEALEKGLVEGLKLIKN
jgi:tRNA 2-selenouridine synthase SelU